MLAASRFSASAPKAAFTPHRMVSAVEELAGSAMMILPFQRGSRSAAHVVGFGAPASWLVFSITVTTWMFDAVQRVSGSASAAGIAAASGER
jgi:hypothetical protein